MQKTFWATGLALVAATPLIAQGMMDHSAHGDPAGTTQAPMTRAAVEARVKTHFAEMDANKDGAVTEAEVAEGRAARMAERHGDMFTKMDADKNGSISRAEFDAHHQAMMQGGAGKHMGHGMKMNHRGEGHLGGMGQMGGMNGRMFAMADANKDGKVTQAEANTAALAQFERADANKDGTVSVAERKAMRDKLRAAMQARKMN